MGDFEDSSVKLVYKSIVLFITKNHTVHRFNVCTRNIIQIEYKSKIMNISIK